MKNLSRVFQKQTEFHNSIQDWIFTTVYLLSKSAWKNACYKRITLKHLLWKILAPDNYVQKSFINIVRFVELEFVQRLKHCSYVFNPF